MPPISFDRLASGVMEQALCTFKVDVTYQPRSGGIFVIRGIFDDRAREVDPDTEVVVSTNIFTLGIKLSDLPVAPQKGDKCTIEGKQYKVIDSQEDGVRGVSSVLILHEVI